MRGPLDPLLLDDRPEKEPWQGLKDLAYRLARDLPQYPASSPLLISGEWGLGKTSLLWEVQRQLTSMEAVRPRVGGQTLHRVLVFEAWRYEGELPLLLALVRYLWSGIGPLKDLKPEDVGKGKEIWKDLWDASVALAVGMGPGLAQLAIGPLGASAIQSLVQFRKETREGTPEETSEKEFARLTADATEQLWCKFRELINHFWPTADRPLIILIDDLDRCSPSGAVSLLDSIRLILAKASDLNCRFVVALDRGVLSMAVANKFADLGHYEGNRYLEKIFPVSFDLPRPGRQDVARLIEDLLAQLRNGNAAEHLEVLHKAFVDPIFANPRLVKRCINRFLMLLRFESDNNDAGKTPAKASEDELRKRIILVQWMAACERWPALRRLLSRRNSNYWERVRMALGDPNQKLPDTDAETLLMQPDLQTWLSFHLAEGAEPLYQAEQRLQRWGL
ncbi:MAG TPA: hypothetical protein DD490_05970 [Acidobacteria bacterium]|nr:hypothetical protein [Acidobacteriota bacterium]